MIRSGSWALGMVVRRALDPAMFVTAAEDVGLESHWDLRRLKQAHWRDGEFLHCGKKSGIKIFTLHTARCRHFFNPTTSTRSLTKVQKVCSTERAELFEWAIAQGAYVQGCDCM